MLSGSINKHWWTRLRNPCIKLKVLFFSPAKALMISLTLSHTFFSLFFPFTPFFNSSSLEYNMIERIRCPFFFCPLSLEHFLISWRYFLLFYPCSVCLLIIFWILVFLNLNFALSLVCDWMIVSRSHFYGLVCIHCMFLFPSILFDTRVVESFSGTTESQSLSILWWTPSAWRTCSERIEWSCR